jgi:hypothetical protein
MRGQQKTLAALLDELRTIRVFDRVHDYSANADPVDDQAHKARQVRRAQVLAEIEKLRASRPARRIPISSVLALLSAAGYAMLHYLLR